MNEPFPGITPISEKIIGAAFEVANTLGCGFMEAVYRNSMKHEMENIGLGVEAEKQFAVHFKGRLVGSYYADLVVENAVIVELKAVENLTQVHVSQALNYLRVSGLPLALLLNFGSPKVQVRRVLP